MPVVIATVDIPTATNTQVGLQPQRQRFAPQTVITSDVPTRLRSGTFTRTLTAAEMMMASAGELITFTRANSWSAVSAIDDVRIATQKLTAATTTTTNTNKTLSGVALGRKTQSFRIPTLKEQSVKQRPHEGGLDVRANKTTTATTNATHKGHTSHNKSGSSSGCCGTCVHISQTGTLDLLDCAGRQLSTLPCLHHPFTRLQHGSGNELRWRVQMLRLSRNNLTSLEVPAAGTLTVAQPLALAAFSRVVMLDVTQNKIDTLAGVETMPALRVLLASHNQLRDLAPLFSASSVLLKNGTLEVLDLSFNRIRDILPAAVTTVTTTTRTTKSATTSSLDSDAGNDATETGNSAVLPTAPVIVVEEYEVASTLPLRRLRTLNLSFNYLSRLDEVNMVFPDIEELRVVRNQLVAVSLPLPRRLSTLVLQQNYLSEDTCRCLMELPQRMRSLKVDVSNQRSRQGCLPTHSGFCSDEESEKSDAADDHINNSSGSSNNNNNNENENEEEEELKEVVKEGQVGERQAGCDKNDCGGKTTTDDFGALGTLTSVRMVKRQTRSVQTEHLQQQKQLVFCPGIQNFLQGTASASSVVPLGEMSLLTAFGNSLKCLPPHVLGMFTRLVASSSLRPSKRVLDSYGFTFADPGALGELKLLRKLLLNDLKAPQVCQAEANVGQADTINQRRNLVGACVARSTALSQILLKSTNVPVLDILAQLEQHKWHCIFNSLEKEEGEEEDAMRVHEFYSALASQFPAPRGKLQRPNGVYGRHWLAKELQAPLRWNGARRWHSVHGCCALQPTTQERIDRRRRAPVVGTEVDETATSSSAEALHCR